MDHERSQHAADLPEAAPGLHEDVVGPLQGGLDALSAQGLGDRRGQQHGQPGEALRRQRHSRGTGAVRGTQQEGEGQGVAGSGDPLPVQAPAARGLVLGGQQTQIGQRLSATGCTLGPLHQLVVGRGDLRQDLERRAQDLRQPVGLGVVEQRGGLGPGVRGGHRRSCLGPCLVRRFFHRRARPWARPVLSVPRSANRPVPTTLGPTSAAGCSWRPSGPLCSFHTQ